MDDEYLVQMYAQFEDPRKPDFFNSFTCTTEHDRGKVTKAKSIAVRSYEGGASLKYKDNKKDVAWNKVPKKDSVKAGSDGLWDRVRGDDKKDYKGTYGSSKSWQYCTAVMVLYEARDGRAPDEVMEERNQKYLDDMEKGV